MNRSSFFVFLVVLLFVGGISTPVSADQGPPNAVIVVLRDGVDSGSVAAEHAARHGASVSHVYSAALSGYAARVPANRLAAIAADPRVAFVSDDGEARIAVPNVSIAVGDSAPTGVRRIGAATETLANGAASVAVAVIDTGVDLKHPDLNALNGKTCIPGTKSANDDHGHGTHVAGTIAAKNNGQGVIGVVPGTTIWAVKVLNKQGFGFFSQVICGIDWVTANAAAKNIKVANMSLAGGGADDGNCGNTNNDALHRAICNSVAAGVTYVAAAGNSAVDFSGSVPAAYNEVLTVTAIADFDGAPGGLAADTICKSADVDDTSADFSNFTTAGSPDAAHTIAGPGRCIRSTFKGGQYATFSGTSMATPHAAGTVALCLSNTDPVVGCVGLTPARIIQKLIADANAKLTADPGYGFTPDDPNRFFGPLVWAGAY